MRPLLLVVLLACASGASASPRLYPDSPDSPEVDIDEYIIARAGERDSVQTYGVATCIALSLFDETTFTGSLAHFSATADVPKSVERILAGFPGLRREQRRRLKARLIGGWKNGPGELTTDVKWTSPDIHAALTAALRSQGIDVVQDETLVVPGAPGVVSTRNLVLELATGGLYDYRQTVEFSQPVDRAPGRERFAVDRVLRTHPLSLDARSPRRPAR